MKDKLFESLKKSSADYADIRVETLETTDLAYRGKEIETSKVSAFQGGIVRACTKGGWGIVAFDSLDDLGHRVKQACECAALVGREKTELAEVDPVDAKRQARLEHDFRGVRLDDKLNLIRNYNEIILGTAPTIESSQVGYSDSFRTVHFASTRGTYFMEERPKVTLFLKAIARADSLVQRAYDSFASVTTYDVALGLESKAREVADRADKLLRAPKATGGPQSVILNPVMGGLFTHEAFGHLSEADFLYENPRMRDLMSLGREMGVKNLNIVDDGSMGNTIGSLALDDEGTPTRKTYLIKNGVLAGHLHSLETAAKMDARPTGNARAIGRQYPPIVRMTNTYIENGEETKQNLFAGIDKGVYACGHGGGMTNTEMFTFSAAYGYKIENGQIGDLVRDVMLTGNVFETLRAIDGIANDFKIHEGGGGCGKNGQSPLPVTFGAPHVRIRDVVIGGEQGQG